MVKHAVPILDGSRAARHWKLGAEGKAQAARLVTRMKPYAPLSVYASKELKAQETARIVSLGLGEVHVTREGLEEIDRPVLPLMSPERHRALNKRIFDEPSKPVLGRESAVQAVDRFGRAVSATIEEADPERNVVIISHGTVIALFVAERNGLNAFDLWLRLECTSFVELELPLYGLNRIGAGTG